MKNECSIVRDLLPLKVENMVSKDTDEFVYEHITRCDDCRKEMENLIKNCFDQEKCDEMNEQNIQTMKTIKKKILKKRVVTAFLSVFLSLTIVFSAGYYMLFVGIPYEYSEETFSFTKELELRIMGNDGKADLYREFCASITPLLENGYIVRTKFIREKDNDGNIISFIWQVSIRKPIIDLGQTLGKHGWTMNTSNIEAPEILRFVFANKSIEYVMEEEGLYEPVTYEVKAEWREERLRRGEKLYEDFDPGMTQEEIWDKFVEPYIID